MGEIYLAEDTKLERQIALKFLPKELTKDAEARKRFEREAKAAAALNHPNIVTVYEIGEHEGQVFIAMEYVEGRTLKELISGVGADPRVCPDANVNQKEGEHRGSPLQMETVTAIATQIASGLAAAHAKGIVHRDIKPQNIAIDKDGHVKILDFGLAKLKGASPLSKESFTYGTVHYMSPEQALGKDVDPRSDIWSLGIVLYEMVSGELPFRGEYDQAVIYAIINEEMLPLAIGKTAASAAMENVIRRCLAKKRQERFPAAEALAAALRNLDGAKEDILPEKRNWHEFSRRAFLTGLVLLLLSGILGFLALNPRAHAALKRVLGLGGIPASKHIAVLPIITGNDAENKSLADGFTAVITDKLTWLEKFHDSLWTVPAAEILKNRDKSTLALQRLWGCNLFVSGELDEEKNSLRLQLKLNDAQTGRELKRVELQGHMGNLSLFQDGLLAKLNQLLELKEDKASASFVNAGGTAMPGAFALFLKGKGLALNSADVKQLDAGIALLEKALKQDGGYIQAQMALADALRSKFKLARDPLILQKAMEQGLLARQAAGPWAPAQLAWALLVNENGEKAKALQAFQETLRLNESCYTACIEQAKLCMTMGKINEAESLYKRAIGLRPGYPNALAHLAFFYQLNGRLDEALAQYQQQARLAPGDFACLNNMGMVYGLKGDKANAKVLFEKANAIEPNVTAQSNLATLFFYEGNYRKALPLFREVADKGNDCRWWGNLADTYRQLTEFKDKADAAYRKAIAMAEASLARAPDNFELLNALAMYYAHIGEKSKALESITRARALAPADLETIRRAILAYEAAGERSQALDALREFRERLGGIGEVEKEPDLADLRRDPEYAKIRRD